MKRHPHAEQKALIQTLRDVLKAKGYTYARLAREMGLSEVTVKRILGGSQSCTLDRLVAICERIDVSFLDLAALARKEEEVDHVLTPAQEAYFGERPAHFAIIKALSLGATAEEIRAEFKLTDARFFKVLRALEKLGLLDVLPGSKFRLRVRGNIRWTHRGPLARRILRPQIVSFLDHVDRRLDDDDVCMHSAETEISAAHVAEFVDEIHELGAKYRARAFRDRTLLARGKLKPVRWLFAFAPYRSDWSQYRV
jgi:transcriptional regulator with XRE-family HTH domain